MRALVQKLDDLSKAVDAARPKPEDRTTLRRFFEDNPTLWYAAGDMGAVAEQAVIRHISAKESVKLAIEAGAAGLRRELGYRDASPIERLLVQEIVLAWMQLTVARHKYEGVKNESHSLTVGDYWERRMSAVQQRFLRACSTLAKVRKMTVAVQVNVNQGGQQVNVAGDVKPRV